MQGHIINHDPETNGGTIKGEDGTLYPFTRDELYNGSHLKDGQLVMFTPDRGAATFISILSD